MNTALESSLVLIDHSQDMQPLLEDLENITAVAVDTESNSLYAYYERVCLIQFSTPTVDYLLDPLALPPEEIQQLHPFFRRRAHPESISRGRVRFDRSIARLRVYV